MLAGACVHWCVGHVLSFLDACTEKRGHFLNQIEGLVVDSGEYLCLSFKFCVTVKHCCFRELICSE